MGKQENTEIHRAMTGSEFALRFFYMDLPGATTRVLRQPPTKCRAGAWEEWLLWERYKISTGSSSPTPAWEQSLKLLREGQKKWSSLETGGSPLQLGISVSTVKSPCFMNSLT